MHHYINVKNGQKYLHQTEYSHVEDFPQHPLFCN